MQTTSETLALQVVHLPAVFVGVSVCKVMQMYSGWVAVCTLFLINSWYELLYYMLQYFDSRVLRLGLRHVKGLVGRVFSYVFALSHMYDIVCAEDGPWTCSALQNFSGVHCLEDAEYLGTEVFQGNCGGKQVYQVVHCCLINNLHTTKETFVP